MHIRRIEAGPELLFGRPVERPRRAQDLSPSAVVEGHEEGDPIVAGGQLIGPLHPLRQARRNRIAALADEAQAYVLGVQFRRHAVDVLGNQVDQVVDLLLGRAQFSVDRA